VPKQENANEDVEPHAHIGGNDILNFTYYNLLPHPLFKWKRWVGFFWVKFVIIIPSLIVVFKTFASPSFLHGEGGWIIFLFKVFKQYLKAL
jgi:hypothetical protein